MITKLKEWLQGFIHPKQKEPEVLILVPAKRDRYEEMIHSGEAERELLQKQLSDRVCSTVTWLKGLGLSFQVTTLKEWCKEHPIPLTVSLDVVTAMDDQIIIVDTSPKSPYTTYTLIAFRSIDRDTVVRVAYGSWPYKWEDTHVIFPRVFGSDSDEGLEEWFKRELGESH